MSNVDFYICRFQRFNAVRSRHSGTSSPLLCLPFRKSGNFFHAMSDKQLLSIELQHKTIYFQASLTNCATCHCVAYCSEKCRYIHTINNKQNRCIHTINNTQNSRQFQSLIILPHFLSFCFSCSSCHRLFSKRKLFYTLKVPKCEIFDPFFLHQ